jgi:hypothetical protein
MFKNIVKFLSVLLLFSLIISSNTSAFHKENSIITQKDTEWDGDPKTKTEYENKAKQDWCALKATAKTIKGKPILDENTDLQKIDENGDKVFKEDTYKMELEGYHLREAQKTNGKLLPTLAKLNFEANWDKLKLVDLLKMYCLQDKTQERPSQFKGSYLETLYKEIAADNGFFKKDNVEGNYKKNILEGPHRDDIFKSENGIIINDPNVVWYVPDFLKDTFEQNKKDEAEALAKKKADEKKRKKKKARKNAIIKGNDKWISENKDYYLDLFKTTLNEYSKIIQNLEDNRKILNVRLDEIKNKFDEANEEIEIAFDDLANINPEIKNKKSEIRENKKIYLSKVIIESFDDRLKEINSINFKKYDNYIKLKKIIKKAEKSNSAKDFVGKDGYEIKWPKLLGGGSKNITSDKLGLIEGFEDLKNKSLGSGSKTHSSNMKELDEEIRSSKHNIDEFVLALVQELVAYDNVLEEEKAKFPLMKYAIYLVIFLVVLGCILFLIFYQRKKEKNLKEEAEQKLGSLKSDLEVKLKHTSEQIRSVRTSSTTQSQSQLEAQPVLKEEPKTPEQIITEKYDQLVSDYKDALDDFSKVAEFKEKWQGLALTRKERQDGTKTILINSTRAFEKAEIWCVTFSEKYFAFPGSSVKFNMATYMNLDFEKAGRDFKGVFSISSGSNYSTEPSVLRRGGAGFVVERSGKIAFPN